MKDQGYEVRRGIFIAVCLVLPALVLLVTIASFFVARQHFLTLFGWAVFFGVMLGSIFLLSKMHMIFTHVPEGWFRVYMKSGQFHSLIWNFKHHVKLSNGKILHLNELFLDPKCTKQATRSDIEKLVDGSLRDASGARVSVVYTTTRYTQFYPHPNVAIPVQRLERRKLAEGEEEKYIPFKHNEIFLDRNYDPVEKAGDHDRSIEEILKAMDDMDSPTPLDFFNQCERGFYVYYDKAGGGRYEVKRTDTPQTLEKHKTYLQPIVLQKYIFDIRLIPVPSRDPVQVEALDHGPYAIFGGLHIIPFWETVYVYAYHQVWDSIKADGELEHNDEVLRHGILKVDQYAVLVSDAEDINRLPVSGKLLLKAIAVDPYRMLFGAEKWLEIATNLVRSRYRKLIASATFDEINRQKSEKGEQWSKEILHEIHNRYGEHFENEYGFRVTDIDPVRVDIGGSIKTQEKYHDVQAQKWVAEQEAAAIEVVFSKIKEYGELGEKIRFMDTLKELKGNTFIPIGGITEFLNGTLNPTRQKQLFKDVADAGLTSDQLVSAVLGALKNPKIVTALKEALKEGETK